MNEEKQNRDKQLDDVEIPDEFLDPIMASIMTDPVLLPTSDQIMDRITIQKYLLEDPIDPFNRKPLTKEMLIPQVELKARIEKFMKEKLNK